MQANSRNKNNRRGKGRGRAQLTREYAAPILRKIEKPFTDVTLFHDVTVTSGVTGTNGMVFTIYFSDFSDIAEFSGVYKYFEITGYKFDFSLATTTAAQDSFYGAALGLNTTDYVIGEPISSTIPVGIRNVMDLPGAIFVQEGASNRGRWCPPVVKQVFSVRDVTANVRPFANLTVYANDIGVSETIGICNVMLNIKLYGKDYSANI